MFYIENICNPSSISEMYGTFISVGPILQFRILRSRRSWGRYGDSTGSRTESDIKELWPYPPNVLWCHVRGPQSAMDLSTKKMISEKVLPMHILLMCCWCSSSCYWQSACFAPSAYALAPSASHHYVDGAIALYAEWVEYSVNGLRLCSFYHEFYVVTFIMFT